VRSTLDEHSYDTLLNPFSQAVVLVPTRKTIKRETVLTLNLVKISGFETKMQLYNVFLRNVLR